MTNAEMTTHLEMRWVPVTDPQGRTRMEAVWIEVGQPSTLHSAA
ncbi:hypothetical protein ACFQ0K_07710 [Nocardioides caeni]|nr:hypothetical protein [Nocardioides caeni]